MFKRESMGEPWFDSKPLLETWKATLASNDLVVARARLSVRQSICLLSGLGYCGPPQRQ